MQEQLHPHLDEQTDISLGESHDPAFTDRDASASDVLALPKDLRLANNAQPRVAAPHEIQYPIQEQTDESDYSPAATDRAIECARSIFPDASFSLLSTEGSSAIVLEDGKGKVFKVFRRSDDYSYYESEAAAATALHAAGIGPRPWLFVDTAVHYRGAQLYRSHQFSEVPIVRADGPGDLPVLVCDKVNVHSVEEMGDERLLSEFDRATQAMLDHGLKLGDTELVYDPDLDKVQVIDAGGLERPTTVLKYRQEDDGSVTDFYPSIDDEAFKRAVVVASSVGRFLRNGAGNFIDVPIVRAHFLLQKGGLDALHQRMLEIRAMPANSGYVRF